MPFNSNKQRILRHGIYFIDCHYILHILYISIIYLFIYYYYYHYYHYYYCYYYYYFYHLVNKPSIKLHMGIYIN